MAIIKSKIENLKPGKDYIVTVRAKNVDLNVLSDYSDTIRFQVPTDDTIPSAITNLNLYSGIESVMFVFDYSQDLDISRYEYELYDNDSLTGTPLTGTADANVFTVRVENLVPSEDPTEGLYPYWGRVRAVDTTGNVGPWTSLVQTDPHTPLIDNQYIGSLTASKITAGTIGAHTIQLNGTNSIIQSTTYEDTSGSKGWQIKGDGHFTFGGPNGITYDNETITIGTAVQVNANLSADSITVGTAPNQLHINDAINSGSGGMTLGDPTYNYWYTDGEFRVGNATNYAHWNGTSLVVQGTIQAGNVGGVNIGSTKLYIGAGTFNDPNTAFYVDSSGQFSLKDKLSWNGTSLTISGDVTIGSTTGSSIESGAASGASALQPGEAASDVNSNSTTISGGKIRTGTIESTGYSYSNGDFSAAGTQINLDNGLIRSKNFAIDSSGSAYFRGNITASSGTIAGWNIGDPTAPDNNVFYDALYSGSGSTFSLLSPAGTLWASTRVITPLISGFGDGTSTEGAGFGVYRLRNIAIGTSTTQPANPVAGDVYFRY